MKRWHDELAVALRRRSARGRLFLDDRPSGCTRDEQVGRFRKYNGLGCRRPQCQLCHFEKTHRFKGYRERLADCRFREQLADQDED